MTSHDGPVYRPGWADPVSEGSAGPRRSRRTRSAAKALPDLLDSDGCGATLRLDLVEPRLFASTMPSAASRCWTALSCAVCLAQPGQRLERSDQLVRAAVNSATRRRTAAGHVAPRPGGAPGRTRPWPRHPAQPDHELVGGRLVVFAQPGDQLRVIVALDDADLGAEQVAVRRRSTITNPASCRNSPASHA
jgi:hypothetical protein